MTITDAELAIVAAETGASVVRRFFGEPVTRFAKSPTDFATAADLGSEEAILGAIRASRPHDAFVGEETGRSGAGADGRTWYVDPLCGTLNFAAGTTLVAVNVALLDANGPIAAAVAEPFSGEVYWTGGDGAYVRRDGEDAQLKPTAVTQLVDLDLDVPHGEPRSRRMLGLLADQAYTDTFGTRVVSSSLALLWVAAGRRAAYVIDKDLRDSVHFEAGFAVCRAAGVVMTNLDGGPVHTGGHGLIAAADEETHAALLASIVRSGRS
jgi:myo-inositol-1(or 4)-monophosphatase